MTQQEFSKWFYAALQCCEIRLTRSQVDLVVNVYKEVEQKGGKFSIDDASKLLLEYHNDEIKEDKIMLA